MRGEGERPWLCGRASTSRSGLLDRQTEKQKIIMGGCAGVGRVDVGKNLFNELVSPFQKERSVVLVCQHKNCSIKFCF